VPRVSVLMPTHNRADVVGLAIDSVLAQTMADFELLVVADGCSDRTFEILGQLRDDRVRVFDLPKAPHFGYANRNVALREARGDVIAFAAHDDLLFPDHLEQLVGAMEETSAEWMYSRPLWVSPDGLVVPFCTNLTVPLEVMAALPFAADDRRDGIVGLSFAMRQVAQLLLMCDRQDIGIAIGGGDRGESPDVARPGEPMALSDEPRIFVYDAYPGGIGFSEPLFAMDLELRLRTRQLVAACACEHGCPTCVGPIGQTGPLAKTVALRLLEHLEARDAEALPA
jgi:glycosyltransferase involved in cell wall biosynthesis